MAIIYKFTGKKNKQPYSETFINNVDAIKVADFLRAENPNLPDVILLSMAHAIIASTHLQLLLDEYGIVIPDSVYESLDDNNVNYLDYGKETLH